VNHYVDIHLIHPVPYANLNRDDLGSPKAVTYGGVSRTRVSSQCWKRAVRLDLERSLGEEAARTRRVPHEVATSLREAGWPQELADFAGAQVAASAAKGLKVEDGGRTSVLLFLPKSAIADLATLCEEHRETLETAFGKASKAKAPKDGVLAAAEVNALITGRTATINLFGRMLAELPTGNVDGAVQVAHAFTTHESDTQVDFFTAVDDWNPDEETGSGHMNSAEFSAGVFYRYASVNVDDLVRNLNGDTGQAHELVAGFLTTFIEAMPQAKKNSTAPFTVPELAYVAVRADRPLSLAGAFEMPVRPARVGGLAEPSRDRLAEYAGRIDRLIGSRGRAFHGHASVDDKALEPLGTRFDGYADLVSAAVAALTAEGARP